MKKIHFEPSVPAEIRVIPQHIAMTILEAIHRYAETGVGRIKPLSGEFEGFLRLRVGNHRVFFKETEDSIVIHRVRDRREAYR
ncbi:MAG: type II toxin-antitoxin system RelE/ParE family toxin [Acidobacteriaceae bacterium]|nr:type II toxin-antitoxin system RelE/ParE family toxin [Acidobacteriaceae bacterium]